MKISNRQNNLIRARNGESGFTLIETLIYLALLGLALTSFISFGMSISTLRNKTNSMEAVVSGSRLAIDIMSRKIREAKSVETPALGQTSDTLRLSMPDGSFVTFATSSDSGVLIMAQGDGNSIPVAPESIIFPTLTFTNLGETGAKDSIQIKITVKYKNENSSQDFDYSEDFETTVNVKDTI